VSHDIRLDFFLFFSCVCWQVQELYEEISKYKEDSSKMWTELVAEKEKVTDLEER